MLGQCITKNESLIAWVKEMAHLCQPTNVHWCDGSDEEYQYLCDLMVKSGTFTKLNENKRPNSYLARSHPSDVARVEDRTFICTKTKEEAGPNNNWADPDKMKAEMLPLYKGCMKKQNVKKCNGRNR